MNTKDNGTMQKDKEKKHSAGKFGGLIAVLVFVILVFIFNIGMLNKKYDTPANRTQYPVVYTKNNTLSVKKLSKKANTLSDYLMADPASDSSPRAWMSENGQALYFLENYDDATQAGSFFASFDGKNKVSISSKAHENIQLTADGNYALFIEQPDLEKNSGPLYLYKKNGEKEKIADDISLDHFLLSEDMNYIGYIQTTSGQLAGDFYIQKLHGDKEKIDSDVSAIISLSGFNSSIYLKNTPSGNAELYYWNKKKGAVKLANDAVLPVYTSKYKDNLIFCGKGQSQTSRTLYSKQGKKSPVSIDTNVVNVLGCDPTYQNVVYTKDFSQSDFSYDTYIKRGTKKAVKLLSSSDKNTSVMYSYDFSAIAYISDMNPETKSGNLYLKKFGMFGGEESELIAQNVTSFKLSRDGSMIAYVGLGGNSKTFYLYHNKKSTVISENIEDDNYQFTNDGKGLYYIANYTPAKSTGNLFMVKTSKSKPEPIKIDSDVSRMFYPRSEKQVIYTKDYNIETGESSLYIWKGKSKTEHIDTGIINVLFEQ